MTRPGPAGKEDQAVGPRVVRKRRLELVGVDRQAVADDRLHACLPEGAARLLVGEDVLQFDHLAREGGDRLLRLVDDREPLAEPRQALLRRPRGIGHRLADPVPELVEPIGKSAHMAGDLALRPHEVREARIHDVLAAFRKLGNPRRRPTPGNDGDGEEPKGNDEQHGKNLDHRSILDRFCLRYKTGTARAPYSGGSVCFGRRL